jgi:hypothetical protein
MQCIKTGCHVWLDEYDEWAYGDAFQSDEVMGSSVFVFRIVSMSFNPIAPKKHFTILKIDHLFRDGTSSKTLICPHTTTISETVINHGYDGIPVAGDL